MNPRIFLHGLESSSRGTKSVFFREHYPGMLTPDFTGSLEARMGKLNRILGAQSHIVIVGSSFGGLMGSVFAMENQGRVSRLILLAPALNLLCFSRYEMRRISIPVHVYHGKKDEVVPLGPVRELAEQWFDDLDFNEVDDDHFLHQTFQKMEWERLLS